MSAGVIVERITPFSDARGLVVEPLTTDLIAAQQNVHIVLTEPGCIRGNHYHMRGTEITLVIGPALARIREGGEVRDTIVPDGEAFRFTIPAGVPHAFQNIGTKPIVLVGFNTEPHDRTRPDVVQEVLIAA
jgi:UDP-2-acetamido-2,6-beta-L-arabino-hexul-4-ose reductase